MPKRNAQAREFSDSASAAAPSSYDPSSRPSVTLNGLVQIPNDYDAEADVTGGYEGEVSSINGNSVVVQINNLPDPTTYSGSESSFDEVNSGTDLSSETIRVRANGV